MSNQKIIELLRKQELSCFELSVKFRNATKNRRPEDTFEMKLEQHEARTLQLIHEGTDHCAVFAQIDKCVRDSGDLRISLTRKQAMSIALDLNHSGHVTAQKWRKMEKATNTD